MLFFEKDFFVFYEMVPVVEINDVNGNDNCQTANEEAACPVEKAVDQAVFRVSEAASYRSSRHFTQIELLQ